MSFVHRAGIMQARDDWLRSQACWSGEATKQMGASHSHFPVDLHTHTTASDGTDSPAELVRHARETGVAVIGITDHDTVAGLEEALEAGAAHGVEVVAGVEISIADEPGRDFRELHLLGYFIDPRDPHLTEALRRAAAARNEQKLTIVRNLQDLGFDVPLDQVLALAGEGVLGRLHIAQVALTNNRDHFSDPDQLFREYISPGGLAYAPRRYKIRLEVGIALIREAGGMPVLAHPGANRVVVDMDAVVQRCAELGIGGLEGSYTYDKNRLHFGMSTQALRLMIAHYESLARHLGLVITGGSDYHGQNKSIALGEQGLALDDFRRLQRIHCQSAPA